MCEQYIMPKSSTVKCMTVVKNHKRRPILYNSRTEKALPIVVGSRGGLSVKSPNAKTRRYVKKQCNKMGSKHFWSVVKSMQEKKK